MIELFNRDCLEAMREMPDKCFDLAIVDPPYGISIHKMNYTQSTKGGVAKRKDYSSVTDWDSNAPSIDYFNELRRVSMNQIIWGANYFIESLGSCKGFIVWDKRTSEKYSNDFADCEYAWCSLDTPARVFRFLWSGMMQNDMKNKEERIHPTQKPVKLYEWLLTNYAKPGDKILDTHLGSGSIAIACHNLGYDLTAFEIDREYFEAASKRLKDHQSKPTLFPITINQTVNQQDLFK